MSEPVISQFTNSSSNTLSDAEKTVSSKSGKNNASSKTEDYLVSFLEHSSFNSQVYRETRFLK
ncbi:MAG: hypothetical protein VZR27_08380 [Acutalibacteraceae bacterium]|nr:hypothetical protein [Acutalibacteraceae bacterium]